MRVAERIDGYAPIRDYAAIGNKRSGALVALDGSIDWLCLPRFDSPAVFGALLDPARGGRFALGPAGPFEAERRYVDGTNVLETTYRTGDGTIRVSDWMSRDPARPLGWTEIVRRVEGLAGSVPLRWRVEPRFNYGHREGELRNIRGNFVICDDELVLGVHAWGLGEPHAQGAAIGGEATIEHGDRGIVVMTSFTDGPLLFPAREMVEHRYETTCRFWRHFTEGLHYNGDWGEAVIRSVLALDLLVHEPDASMIAALTTALPERIGGERNYDYRYAWVRDTTFALDALLRLGYRDAVQDSLAWLVHTARRTHPRVHTFYGIDGRVHDSAQQIELAGYRDSRPVLIGNDAGGQLQLGNFGDLMQTTWLFVKDGNAVTPEIGLQLSETIDLLCEVWRNPDSGIWELQDKRDYTQSKMMVWLAFERALELAKLGELERPHVERWRKERDAVRELVAGACWDEARGTWKRDAHHDGLDAAVLLMAGMDLVDPGDPRMQGTVDVLRRELGRGPLIYRYSGMESEEGCFLACSFWIVEAYARGGRLDEARELMEQLIPLSNEVGLYSEEMDPATNEMLGNFPQALTHLSLVNAAFAIERGEGRA